MTVLSKTLMKRDVVHSFGCKFDDLLTQAEKEVAASQASQGALIQAKKKVEELCVAVQKEADEGKLEEEMG
jgi:hypothetical protein